MSPAAAVTMADDLARYPEPAVLTSLSKCRRELSRFPTIADIILRIEDGRPGVEEAWAMLPRSEADSVVWTTEMADAFTATGSLISEDKVAARMAFKEKYEKLLSRARDTQSPIQWVTSLGFDVLGREKALLDAVQKGRLPLYEAQKFLPHKPNGQIEPPKMRALPGAV